MDSFLDIIKNARFEVTRVDFETVDTTWENYFFLYDKNRIYYITNGEADLTLKNQVVHLKAKTLYYLPSYSVVEVKCKNFLSHHFIHFEWDGEMKDIFPSLIFKTDAIAEDSDEQIFMNLQKIMQKKRNIKTELEINGYMQILFSRFIAERTFSVNHEIFRFAKILKFIDENINNKITIKDLAARFNYSEAYFSSSFSKVFKMPPLQYIHNKKVSRAIQLLTTTTLTVKEISYDLGFDDSLYFSRLFRRNTGLSPCKFRQTLQKRSILAH